MSPSEEIKQSCCGSLLECKQSLIKRVENMEQDLVIKNAEIEFLKKKVMSLEGSLLLYTGV